MNPLSDGFVDAEAIAQHRQQLLNAAADRAHLFAHEDGIRPPGASKRWSRWAGRLFRIGRPLPALGTPLALVGPADQSHRECPLARRRCA
jgi:hypothetical protein